MGLFGRNHQISNPPDLIRTSCPPGLENSNRESNVSSPISGEVTIVSVDENEAYFQTHGTFPPFIEPGTTLDDLRARIESTRILASQTRDVKDASRYINEIGYLQDKLNRGI